MSTLELVRQMRFPRPADIVQAAVTWWRSDSRWWAASVVGHTALLGIIVLFPMAVPSIQQDAPAFDAKLDTALPEPDLSKFELGETPIEPTVLNTETLTMTEAPQIEQAEEFNDNSATFEHRGGGSTMDTKVASIGGLGGFSIDAIGPGPAVRGAGGVGLGAGSGGPGSGGEGGTGFGGRGSGMRKAMLGSGGGTLGTERAVQGGLFWLARHQNADGSWSLHQFASREGRCNCTGAGKEKSDAAATAMALLPYLAAGQTHETKGPFQKTVYSGLDWLMKNQKPDGDLSAGAGQKMYTHGLAAIAMCEAYGLSKDSRVGKSAQAAIRYIEAGQDPQTGGWWYQFKQPGGDTSVFGWQLMAIKSAQMAGLDVKPATFEGAHRWLKLVARGSKGGLFCYRPDSGPSPTMTAVGLLCSQYLGSGRSDPAIVEGMNYFMAHLPSNATRNCYYWYYATQVMHNLPGPEWDKWNREMRRILIDSQDSQGCAVGSWDPAKPSQDPWGDSGGRIMVTSIATLTLEVYYRYLPLYQLDPTSTVAAAPMDMKAAPKTAEKSAAPTKKN